jgi:putative transposase
LYYKPKLEQKDRSLLKKIQQSMEKNPSYGHRRIALALKINPKRALRVMQKFELKPLLYRKRSKFNHNKSKEAAKGMNLIKNLSPIAPNYIWVTDFTYLRFKRKFVYLATVIDVFTRQVIGWNMSLKHDKHLTQTAIEEALKQGKANYLHSDRGAEYNHKELKTLLETNDIQHSRSDKCSPWQNSWQESFYSQFKLELGGTAKYQSYEELIEAVAKQINYYNNERIHLSLKMSPNQFRAKYSKKRAALLSKKMGT